jgi:hypothetical protein
VSNDEKGHVVEYNVYNPDGSVISTKNTNRYDDKGQLVEKGSYNPDGSIDHKWAYKFDNRGIWLNGAGTNLMAHLMVKLLTTTSMIKKETGSRRFVTSMTCLSVFMNGK